MCIKMELFKEFEKVVTETEKLKKIIDGEVDFLKEAGVDTSLENGKNWWKCSTCPLNNSVWRRKCEECTRTRYSVNGSVF